MLSRVANSIYWLSRYMERAENVSRFIDVNLQMMLAYYKENKIEIGMLSSMLTKAFEVAAKKNYVQDKVFKLTVNVQKQITAHYPRRHIMRLLLLFDNKQ